MRTWKHAGARLAVETWGAGAVRAVLLHEGLGSIALWKGFPEALAGRVGGRVLAYDRRGHGASDPLDAPRRPDFMHREAEVLAAFLEAEGAGDAVLVGHSDGASIALLHAARRPVRGLALMAPHVFVESLSLASIRDARERFAGTDLRARLARYHRDPEHTFRAWNDIWLDPAFASWTIEAEAARVEAPLLVLQGRDDAYGTAAQYERLAAAAPQADVLVLGRCGHDPARDRPGATLDAIASFIERCA